jgi:hypothetical protein
VPQNEPLIPHPGAISSAKDGCMFKGQKNVCEGNKVCAYNPQGKGQLQCRNPGASNIPVDDYLPLLMLAGIAYASLRLRQ